MKKIFIDCGGHMGESIKLFKKSKQYDLSYEIYSFEPVSYLFEKYSDWDDIICFNKAIWIYDGVIEFFLSRKSDDGNTLFKNKKTGGVDTDNPIKVECVDFSKWIINNFYKDYYIVLKMDIEGAEFKVLNKMIEDRSIEYINKLYVEWHFAFDDFPDKKLYENILEMLKNENLEVYPEMKKCLNIEE